MKKVYFIILSLIIFIGCVTTQKLTLEERKIQYIIDAPAKTKAELYNLSGEWFAQTFRSAQDVIQYQNPEEGKIIGRGRMQGGLFGMATLEFLLTVEVKDGRVRATFDDMYSVMSGSSQRVSMMDGKGREAFKKSSDPMIADLTQYLNAKTEEW